MAGLGPVRWTLPFLSVMAYIFILITFKFRVADIVLGAGLLAVLVQRRPLKMPPMTILLGALVAWSVLGWTLSAFPEQAWDGTVTQFKALLILWLVINAITEMGQLKLVLLTYFGSFVLVPARASIVAFLGGHSWGGRAVGAFIYENPNALAALSLLALGAGLTFAALLKERERRWQVVVFPAIGALLVLILMTQSRGAFLGLCAMAAPFLLGSARGKRMRLVYAAALAAVAVVIAPAGVWERVSGLSRATSSEGISGVDPEGSAEARLEILMTGAEIVGDNFLLGTGFETFEEVHARYNPALGFRDPHNTYLAYAAETGLVGLGLFMAMVVLTLRRARRVRRRLRKLPAHSQYADALWWLELTLLGLLTTALFSTLSRWPYIYLWLAFAWIMTNFAEEMIGGGRALQRGPRGRRRWQSAGLGAGRGGAVAPR